MNKTSKTKKGPWKIIRIAEILKDVIIKKEIDEKVDSYEKQLRFKWMKLLK